MGKRPQARGDNTATKPASTTAQSNTDLFAAFASASNDKTDPQQLATITGFASNLATLQGTNQGSSKAARDLVEGRHANSAAVLNQYAAAGEEITPEMRGIIDELDNLAHHGNSISGMDDRIRMRWSGAGAGTYDIKALERRESELNKQLADLTRGVMTEPQQLALRSDRAKTTIIENQAEQIAAAASPAEVARWDSVLDEMTIPQIGQMLSEGKLQDIPRAYVQDRQQAMIKNKSNEQISLLQGNVAANALQADKIAVNYSDPQILINLIDEFDLTNQQLIENGEPALREIDLGAGVGKFPAGIVHQALGLLVEADESGRLVGSGTDLDIATKTMLNQIGASNQNRIGEFYLTLQRMGVDISTSNNLTAGVQAVEDSLTSALLRGDLEEAGKAGERLTDELGKAREELVKGAGRNIPELEEAYRSLFNVDGFTNLGMAQDYLENITDDQREVEVTEKYKEVNNILEILESVEFASDAELYSDNSGQRTPASGRVPLPLHNLFSNDPNARASLKQAFVGEITSDILMRGIRASYAQLGQEISARSDLQDGQKADMLERVQAMHDEIFNPITGTITGSAARNLIGRVDFKVTDRENPESTAGVTLPDMNGNPVQVKQLNLSALTALSLDHQATLVEMGIGEDVANPLKFAFDNMERFSEEAAEAYLPRSGTDKALLSMFSERYANNVADREGRVVLRSLAETLGSSLEKNFQDSFINKEFEEADSVLELAVSNDFESSSVYEEAKNNYLREIMTDTAANNISQGKALFDPEAAPIERPTAQFLLNEGFLSRQQLSDFNRQGN